jgi:zinc/manganese transport system substrate-binding protein
VSCRSIHSRLKTASAGAAYLWHGTRFSIDMLAGSGLRTVPSNQQVNLVVSHVFKAPGGPITVRAALINLLDKVYLLRSATGVGEFANQYGPRRTLFIVSRRSFKIIAVASGTTRSAASRLMPDRRRYVAAVLLGGLFAIALASAARAAPIRIAAAENFYGEVARRIGGADVAVTSILANPDADPHEFETNAAAARAIADAAIVVFNGAGYDPWVEKLLSASPSRSRRVFEVAALVGKKSGDNPHLWYEPSTMPALAAKLAATLSTLDPAGAADYAQRLARFRAALAPLNARIAALRSKYAGTPVTATEPVFGYMADALGLVMHDRQFQLAVMNGTEPSAAAIASLEHDLRTRSVRVLFYNVQTTDALTGGMRRIAEAAHIPVVGVRETKPPGQDYEAWMLSTLAALERALDH